jgi:hypothetical protein
MASGSLPKSPVSSSLCDEVPHIFIRKTHLQPREFLISSGKGLLQHNQGKSGHGADIVQPRLAKWRDKDLRSKVAARRNKIKPEHAAKTSDISASSLPQAKSLNGEGLDGNNILHALEGPCLD